MTTPRNPRPAAPAPTPAGAPFRAEEVRFPADGLVAGIVQDVADGRVLMVAWLDAEALDATLQTGEVHFHSRSRNALWKKGESSGNTLRLVSIATDCDGDALLITAEPTGPTCHRFTRSCFDPEGARATVPASASAGAAARPAAGFAWLNELWATIAERAEQRPAGSYTVRLLEGGVDAVARKVTEEATEVLMAAKDDAFAEERGMSREGTHAAFAGETADLLFHTLVLLAERGLPPSDVLDVLRRRHGPR